ncbi:uncharacterized protein LOC144160136 [Haemaphysalis longicornis]
MPVQLAHVVVVLCGLLFVGWYAGPIIGKILPRIGFRDGTPAPLLLTGTDGGATSESAINARPLQGSDSVAQNKSFATPAQPDRRQDGAGDVAFSHHASSGSGAARRILRVNRAALSYVSTEREEPIATGNSGGEGGARRWHRNLDGDVTRGAERKFAWSPDDSVRRRETNASSPSSASSFRSRLPAARASFPLGGKPQPEETDPLPSPAPAVSRQQHQHERLVTARLPDLRTVAWQQRRPCRASTLVFGELLQESQQRLPVSFGAMLEEIGVDGWWKLHESSSSEVFRVEGSRGVAVLKVLHFAYLVRHLKLVLADVRIARALQGLTKNPENSTVGFAELRTTYCVWDKYPITMANARMNYHRRKKFSVVGNADQERFQPYVVMYMSFAGWPLNEFQVRLSLQDCRG